MRELDLELTSMLEANDISSWSYDDIHCTAWGICYWNIGGRAFWNWGNYAKKAFIARREQLNRGGMAYQQNAYN